MPKVDPKKKVKARGIESQLCIFSLNITAKMAGYAYYEHCGKGKCAP
jgi:hypothetical protein